MLGDLIRRYRQAAGTPIWITEVGVEDEAVQVLRPVGVIDDLLTADVPTRDAVLMALLARYLKRLCLHLANIATSVVMPLHRLDYFDEKREEPDNGATDSRD